MEKVVSLSALEEKRKMLQRAGSNPGPGTYDPTIKETETNHPDLANGEAIGKSW